MGHVQSVSSAHQVSTPPEPEANGDSIVATPNPLDAIANEQTPVEKEEGSVSRRRVGRRRSLMKLASFPSLRKKSRSVVGLSNEGGEESTHPSPSRRRWRAFSGLKSRPVSTIADSSVSTTTGEQQPEVSSASIQEQASNRKGKERETELTGQESDELEETMIPARDPTESTPGPSNPPVAHLNEHGYAFSPDAMFRELRELQDTLSERNDPQYTATNTSQADDAANQTERPPTPIPTSAIESLQESGGDRDGSPARPQSMLAEALGSWMGGRPRRENVESTSSDDPVSVSPRLRSQSVGPQAPQRTSSANNSYLLDSPPGNTERRTDATRSVPPVRPMSGSRFGQNPTPTPTQQDRRTLPPAGTGTLVVVQGVVHTTDVRHSHTRSSSRSQTPSASTLPRSASSTPTLRPTSRLSISRSPSRASTPQPQSSPRRGRFSSLTSNLRPRSRPETTSSIRSGTGSWENSPPGPGNPNTREASEGSDGVGLSSSASDSETTSASTSSADPPVTRDDTSVREASNSISSNEVVQGIEELPLRNPSRTRTEEGGTQPTDGQPDGHGTAVDSDGSEEESEAELSASSIEVLGTLLSVATAATAASLVTGTTDPLFSSGLAGPRTNQRNATSPMPGSSNTGPASSSPQDTESSTPPGSGADNNNAEAVVNTRMRAAWESLRDRFSRTRGRRGTAVGGPGADPREQMLREMARAFNTGLGLDPDDDRERWGPGSREGSEGVLGESAAASDASSSQNEPSLSDGDGRTAPSPDNPGPGPEGSFERFLHNLQVDLRTALTEDYAARRARAQARDARSADSVSSSIAEPLPSVSPEPTSSDERPEERTSSSDVDVGADPSSPPLIPTVPNTPRPATLDLPSLPGDAEASGSGVGHVPAQAHGITGQPGAGINWWRLYRFPPMQLAPHPSTLATGGVPATQSRSPLSETVGSRDGGAGSHSQPQAPVVATNPETTPNQDVVPVIVVGLQSVPVNRGGAHHHHHHHHDPPSPLDTHSQNNGSDSSSDSPARERPWPLRAASRAFGRRSRRSGVDPSADDGVTPPGESADPTIPREGRHGGRTYLIFVIGGYYPPNHSIVTGADDMNSFEALWELAELLGQVKPPVASKEDIERSGLEIIKASSLSDYEQRGKVASNTVDRCLICLDDYEREDELRLLSCRHVFHKQCVDKWLEQGRNNCPACRTTGVRTGDDSPPSDNHD